MLMTLSLKTFPFSLNRQVSIERDNKMILRHHHSSVCLCWSRVSYNSDLIISGEREYSFNISCIQEKEKYQTGAHSQEGSLNRSQHCLPGDEPSQPVAGVIGAAFSGVSIMVANILKLFKVREFLIIINWVPSTNIQLAYPKTELNSTNSNRLTKTGRCFVNISWFFKWRVLSKRGL